VLALAHEQGFAQRVATGTLLQGWALAVQGQHAEGLARLRQGLAAYRATGAKVGRTYFLDLLADACGQAGNTAEGLSVLSEALALADQHGEHFHEAELYRLKGELLLTHTPARPYEAETCLQQAVTVARRQRAKSLELRVALSLGLRNPRKSCSDTGGLSDLRDPKNSSDRANSSAEKSGGGTTYFHGETPFGRELQLCFHIILVVRSSCGLPVGPSTVESRTYPAPSTAAGMPAAAPGQSRLCACARARPCG
jgi:hypothetical protein